MRGQLTSEAALLGLMLTLSVMGPSSYGKQGMNPQAAQIKVTTELMQIRAVVTDRSGNDVEHLSKDDFILREDGVPQPIAFFSVETNRADQGPVPPRPAPASRPDIKASGFPSKTAQAGRSLVLLVDDLHTSFEGLARVRSALSTFVDKMLTNRDVVCLKTTTGSLGVLEQFTRNRQILHRGIEKISPWRVSARESLFTPSLAAAILRGDKVAMRFGLVIMVEEGDLPPLESMVLPPRKKHQPTESMQEKMAKAKARAILAEARYQRLVMVSSVAAVVDELSEMPGQRIIAMFSDGFTASGPHGYSAVGDLNPIISRAARSGVVVYTFNAKGLSVPMTTASSEFGGAVMTSIYTDGLMSHVSASEHDLTHGLTTLASETGGTFFNNANDLSVPLEKMLNENSYRYELAYYAPSGKNPDKPRSIDIAIRNHPEYKVRAQKSYVLSDLRRSEPEVEPQTPQGRLHLAMSEPLPVTTIGVTASARTDADQKRLEIWIRGEDLQLDSEGDRAILDLNLEEVIFDGFGNTVKTNRRPIRHPLTQDQVGKLRGKNLQFVSKLELKPGLYHVRIGVQDLNSGRIGTAFVWLEIPR